MPVYKVFLDGEDTGEYVTASSWQDAYFDVSAAVPLTYSSTVELEEVASPEARPGFPVGRRTIRGSGLSLVGQELYLPHKPGRDANE